MIYAYDQNKNKIEATPNFVGFCPGCDERLIPRCGSLKIAHWAHKGKLDCDDWHEPETEWHRNWKSLFGKENCEVVMPPHRADILGNFEVVIELQHSSISIDEILKRENFYKKMIWVIDAQGFAENLFFQKNLHKETDLDGNISWMAGVGHYYSGDAEYLLSWRRKQKRWLPMFGAEMPVMLDLSKLEVKAGIGFLYGKENHPHGITDYVVIKNSLFWMRSFYSESDVDPDPYIIGGSFVTKERFLQRYKPTSIIDSRTTK